MSYEDHFFKNKQDLHKEHAIHDGKNDLSNCVPSCRYCNSQKWEFPLDEWYSEGNPIYNVINKNKIIKWMEEDHKKFLKIRK